MAYKFSTDMPELMLLEIAPKINRVLDLPEQVNDILSLDPQEVADVCSLGIPFPDDSSSVSSSRVFSALGKLKEARFFLYPDGCAMTDATLAARFCASHYHSSRSGNPHALEAWPHPLGRGSIPWASLTRMQRWAMFPRVVVATCFLDWASRVMGIGVKSSHKCHAYPNGS